jgi:hypothetical protein
LLFFAARWALEHAQEAESHIADTLGESINSLPPELGVEHYRLEELRGKALAALEAEETGCGTKPT